MVKLSIIIPLAPGEKEWEDLILKLPMNAEIILAHSLGEKPPVISCTMLQKRIVVIAARAGRGSQMNAGSERASGDYLWFLHADSRFDDDSISALLASIRKHPESLLFFDLAFIKVKKWPMCVNEIGAKIRSNLLKIPFGDQGFCMKKVVFDRIGQFRTDVEYGEDHLLTWQAKKHGVSIKAIQAKLFTSPRKYQKYGWLRITMLYQFLWLRQAFGALCLRQR